MQAIKLECRKANLKKLMDAKYLELDSTNDLRTQSIEFIHTINLALFRVQF